MSQLSERTFRRPPFAVGVALVMAVVALVAGIASHRLSQRSEVSPAVTVTSALPSDITPPSTAVSTAATALSSTSGSPRTSNTPAPTTSEGTSPSPSPQPAASNGRWVMGYYVGYLRDRYPLSAVQWSAMTHVAVGGLQPRPDGSVDTAFFIDAAQGPAWGCSVVQAAHAHGRQAMLMLGGADTRDEFAAAMAPSTRARFVAHLLAIVQSYRFDGIDLDWEPMQAVDGEAVLDLVRRLKAAQPKLLISVPMGVVNLNRPQDTLFSFLPQLAGLVDRINLMSYGMDGKGWNGWRSWHSSPLDGQTPSTPMSIDSSVQAYLKAGVPAAKLGIGIGFYGAYTGVTGPGQANPVLKADDNDMSYANIVTDYLGRSTAHWDATAAQPYLSNAAGMGPLGCTYITYEDPRTMAAKAAYVRRLGLGGVIIWNINEGYLPAGSAVAAGSRDPLMDAVRVEFGRR